MLFALAAGLATITAEDLRKEFPVQAVDAAIVDDASARFAEERHATVDVAMKDVIPIVVRFSDKRCVLLWIRVPYLGRGPSIYCYEYATDKLVDSFLGSGQ